MAMGKFPRIKPAIESEIPQQKIVQNLIETLKLTDSDVDWSKEFELVYHSMAKKEPGYYVVLLHERVQNAEFWRALCKITSGKSLTETYFYLGANPNIICQALKKIGGMLKSVLPPQQLLSHSSVVESGKKANNPHFLPPIVFHKSPIVSQRHTDDPPSDSSTQATEIQDVLNLYS